MVTLHARVCVRRATVLWTCRLCSFEAELDDVVVATARGSCICLRCFVRETGSTRPLSRTLRRELLATLTALEAV